jgi:hypothetical protein
MPHLRTYVVDHGEAVEADRQRRIDLVPDTVVL